MEGKLFMALGIFLVLLLSGCAARRDLKVAACIIKKQPDENKCLEKLAIDTKDASPCDRLREFKTPNGTISFPTRASCYAQVAFWRGEQAVCDGLHDEDEKYECRHRFDLYLETARMTDDMNET